MPHVSESVLSGCRVLDLNDEKGMFCGRLLADMGAEVIRIDSPIADVVDAAYFGANNAGKLDITLNLETERGRQIFKQLVKTAQIVIESYSPGYMDSLGLGYEPLGKINPGLVMASITGFGQSGPYRNYNISDISALAMGGQMYVCGEADSPPLKPFGEQSYYTASLFAANGVMLALLNRRETGKGQYIDISIMECVAATLDHVLVRYLNEDVISKRQGSLHWNNAFRVFPCKDGHILLSLFHNWDTLVELLEAEDMAGDLTDERWQDKNERLENTAHVIEILEKWTVKHEVSKLVELGQLMRFPWAEVVSIPRLMDNPQMADRGFFNEIKLQGSDTSYLFPDAPCRLSRSPWQRGSRVPAIGEHNMEVYHQKLGLTEKAIKNMIKDGII